MEDGRIVLDDYEIKPSSETITPYSGLGTVAWAYSSSPWGSSADYNKNKTTYNVNIPLGKAINTLTFSAVCIVVGNWYGAVSAIATMSVGVYDLLKAVNGDASKLYWKEVRQENTKIAGVYTQYFKFDRSYYLNAACTNPVYNSSGKQVTETLYAMKSTNY